MTIIDKREWLASFFVVVEALVNTSILDVIKKNFLTIWIHKIVY